VQRKSCPPRPTRVTQPCNARSSRTEMENAVAFASVSGTAAVVAFRLSSSRLSACTSLFRPPNRRPKQLVIFHHAAKRWKLSNIWQLPPLRNPSNNDPAAQSAKSRSGREQCPWRPSDPRGRPVKRAACISGVLPESVGQQCFCGAVDAFFSQVCEMRNSHT